MGRQRPVFVYGTLRPGQPNWERLLAERTARVVAGRLPGVALLDCGHYPAAVERTGAGGAIGEVVWIRPVAWPAVLASLDHLEGYDPAETEPLFVRVVLPVDTDDGPVDCWVYLAGRRLAEMVQPVVAGGDWVAHCASLAAYREHWKAVADAGGRAEDPRLDGGSGGHYLPRHRFSASPDADCGS